MRRSRLIAYLIALVTLVCSALIVAPPGAEADTANPEIADEGWFARSKPPAPEVPIPCELHELNPTETPPPVGCGPTRPAQVLAPQAKATGAYVVASAGGETGDDANNGADTGWAAFKWDMFEWSGATVTKFEVSIAQLADNRGFNQGDTWRTGDPTDPPLIQACNVLEGWGAEPGSNPWDARPTDGAECVAPKSISTVPVTLTTPPSSTAVFTFDLTTFAQSWVDGKGYGFVIRPGTPDVKTVEPFQITLSGYYDPGRASPECNSPTDIPNRPCTTEPRNVPEPKVVFQFTPPVEDDFFDDDDPGDIDTGGDEFFEDITTTAGEEGVLEAVPDLDIIPTDEGSELLPEDIPAPADDSGGAADIGGGATQPISRDTPFPWIVLLLLPLAVIAFWGTGTALGPVGDPVPARRGGVSRVLAQRQAANGGSEFPTRY